MPSLDVPAPGSRLSPAVRQLIWFAIVGGSGAVAFIVLSTIAVDLRTGAPDWLVSALCYAVLIPPVYFAHRRFSFRSDAKHSQALPRYVLTQVCAVALAALISYGIYRIPGLPTYVAAFLVSGLTAVFTFAVLKLWAFAVRT